MNDSLTRLGKLRTATAALALIATLIGLLASNPSAHAAAPSSELITTVKSPHSVDETISRLESALKDAGIGVMGSVDHKSNAATAGLELPPTRLLIFGNPKIGTRRMQKNRLIGLDLPMKALAWQDADGQVHLSYTTPSALRERHAIEGLDELFDKMTGALAKFSSTATKAPAP